MLSAGEEHGVVRVGNQQKKVEFLAFSLFHEEALLLNFHDILKVECLQRHLPFRNSWFEDIRIFCKLILFGGSLCTCVLKLLFPQILLAFRLQSIYPVFELRKNLPLSQALNYSINLGLVLDLIDFNVSLLIFLESNSFILVLVLLMLLPEVRLPNLLSSFHLLVVARSLQSMAYFLYLVLVDFDRNGFVMHILHFGEEVYEN